ncbi:LysR family transcriptional regulator [Sphingomonas profundi]|uniref:LysR family transcriptional regulator n=1 Tax=Alterirhizorhabdus profundi TaxID=2681549 RepID=UPI0012E94719|nr:LysR family transcriptional regulator [Sphingomonas profundi]
MQLRLLEYLVALARERHFARAAEACHVSQPTLSAGLVALEEELGKRLVDRERRFIGLTAAGEAVLPWAQQVIAACRGLSAAASETKGALRGELRLGSIPAALPVAGEFARALARLHPAVKLSIRSCTSREIAHGLAAFELDAGVTYTAHEPPPHVIAVPLYEERMHFVTRDDGRVPASIGWAEAMAQRLCLLHQGMQNRRILDAWLAERGLSAHPCATADSYVALLALVGAGYCATIMPDSYVPLLSPWARAIPFDEPMPPSPIGLVVSERAPLGPLASAALVTAERMRTG